MWLTRDRSLEWIERRWQQVDVAKLLDEKLFGCLPGDLRYKYDLKNGNKEINLRVGGRDIKVSHAGTEKREELAFLNHDANECRVHANKPAAQFANRQYTQLW